jgi:aryl-alcohol dehydrogenase-like predicted oxidoreductase
MDRVLVAYSPLAQGLLVTADGLPKAGRRRFGSMAPGAPRAVPSDLHQAVVEIALRHGATLAQVALAWVLGHPNTIAIPGARTLEQLEENAAAADLELSPDEMVRLSALAKAAA